MNGRPPQALNLDLNRNLARFRLLEVKRKITIKIKRTPLHLNSMAVEGRGQGEKSVLPGRDACEACEISVLRVDSRGSARRRCALLTLIYVFCLGFSAAIPDAIAATFSASLDRNAISLGESAVLTLTYNDGTPDELPVLPTVSNLTIRRTGQRSQFNFVNGRSSTQVIHEHVVTPVQPGDYTIPAISVSVEGKILSSQPLALKVAPASTASPAAEGAGGNAFLKLVVDKNQVYLGEVLPFQIQLYARQGRLKQSPQLNQEGFTVGKLVQDPQRTTVVGNQYYNMLTYRTYVIAAKTGRLTLGPVTMPFIVPHPNSRVTIFGEPAEWMDVTLTSEPLTIEVLPLPAANVPADFTGAVGSYTLKASASTNTVAVGDPITLSIQIAGTGPIESLALSSLNNWREFKVYPPNTKVETTDPFGLHGGKNFEQVVIPENAEIKQLPAITFSFFDPARKAYRTLTHPAIPITVRASTAAPAQPTVLANAAEQQGAPKTETDIVHIKTRPGMLGEIRPPLIQQTWFIALQGAPLLAWLAAAAWRKREETLANNPRLRRQRQVALWIASGLAGLRRLAAANQSEEFFAAVFRLLQEQLGERLDMPAFAITEAVLEERLRPRGVAEETLKSLHELFQVCNQARYAPQRSSEELASLVPRVEQALASLRKLKC
jgi:oxygen tolerance protein BatD